MNPSPAIRNIYEHLQLILCDEPCQAFSTQRQTFQGWCAWGLEMGWWSTHHVTPSAQGPLSLPGCMVSNTSKL